MAQIRLLDIPESMPCRARMVDGPHSQAGEAEAQARYPSEVEPMAREYIALSTGTPIDQVAINWRRCTL